jgi:signal transduction histidine kinase
MKIRNRITLWITAAGLLAGLVFSLVISYELIEQPFELLDSELESLAYTLFVGIAPHNGTLWQNENRSMLDAMGNLYWFKLFGPDHDLLYASAMTTLADLPFQEEEGGYNASSVSRGATSLERNPGGATFRTRVIPILSGGVQYYVQIARPMDKLEEEINDLVLSIAVGMVVFAIVLILLGYFVAGKILQPIAAINDLAREISDKTLDKRIPLGKTKDELYVLSSSLNTMFDRLQFSFKRQKEFIANASHELKTPIAMQRLFFDEAIQCQDLPEPFKVKLAGQVGIVMRMTRLVQNLLDLSALEQGEQQDFTVFDLSELLRAVLLEFEEIIQANSITLLIAIEGNIVLQADKGKIQQLLINLVDNAIKYNLKAEGEISCKLISDKKHVLLEISNSGQVISEDQLQLVFNQFYRVEKSRSSTLGGSGLGLTIVKQIVALHRGSVVMENGPGETIVVKVALPLYSD